VYSLIGMAMTDTTSLLPTAPGESPMDDSRGGPFSSTLDGLGEVPSPSPRNKVPAPSEEVGIDLRGHDLPSVDYAVAPISREEAIFRHSGWASRRHAVYRSMIRTHQGKGRTDSFANCGSDCFVMTNQITRAYRCQANYCHDRMCVPCQAKRSALVGAGILRHIRGLDVASLKFVTLTLRHSETGLRDQIDRLFRHAAALRRRKYWHASVTGGIQVLEVKLSKSGLWHPHLHLIVEGRLEAGLLREEWRAITGDSFIVDVRPVRDDQVIGYLTKYLTKPCSTTIYRCEKSLDEFVKSVKGRRVFNTFGSWRGADFEAGADDPHPDAWVVVGRLSSLIARSAWCGETRDLLSRLRAAEGCYDST
jgi:hypothetical protein